MKQILYSLAFLLITSHAAFAQDTIIFRPGPGANDSTDQGGLTGGKDVWVYEGDPASNFGTTPYIEALPISNCNATHTSAFIQFDLSTLPANVDSAFVVFNHYSHTTYCYSGCDANFYFGC